MGGNDEGEGQTKKGSEEEGGNFRTGGERKKNWFEGSVEWEQK